MVISETLLHAAMLMVGLTLIVCGFWGSSQLRWPFGEMISLIAPIGLLLSIVSVVLLVIPTFFT